MIWLHSIPTKTSTSFWNQGREMKIRTLYIFLMLAALSACATDEDKRIAELRAAVPPISGGFTFKQYVTVKPGDKEVLGDEGVFYISPTMFTDEQLSNISQSERGKQAAHPDEVANYFHLINTCFSAVSRYPGDGDAGDAARYLSLVLTSASAQKDANGIRFRLIAWPDFWYDWRMEPAGTGFAVEDSDTGRAFGWTSSRIVVVRDPSVNLDTCLNYRRPVSN